MKPLHWIILALVFFLSFLASQWSEARDRFGQTLPNGAHITLTDEPCNLKNPDTGELLQGFRARGLYQGDEYPACWKNVSDMVYVIWFSKDGKEALGVSQYTVDSFKQVVSVRSHSGAIPI